MTVVCSIQSVHVDIKFEIGTTPTIHFNNETHCTLLEAAGYANEGSVHLVFHAKGNRRWATY